MTNEGSSLGIYIFRWRAGFARLVPGNHLDWTEKARRGSDARAALAACVPIEVR